MPYFSFPLPGPQGPKACLLPDTLDAVRARYAAIWEGYAAAKKLDNVLMTVWRVRDCCWLIRNSSSWAGRRCAIHFACHACVSAPV